MEFGVNMAPRTRNGKTCEGCGTGMLRLGEGEEEECVKIWCQKCWGLSVASLEDRVQELENKSGEGEEEDSFKEFCECEELKAKVTVLEKYGEDQIVKYKGEVIKIESLIGEITELRIKEGKAKVTIDEYGRSLAIKEDLIRKMIEAMEVIRQENTAFKLQCEEFKVAIQELQSRLGESAGAEPMKRREKGVESPRAEKGGSSGAQSLKGEGDEWIKVGRGKALYAEKAKYSYGKGKPNLKEAAQLKPNRQGNVTGDNRKVGELRDVRGRRQPGKGNLIKKDKIVVIGSSMVRNIERNVGMKEYGSYSRSIGGAGIKEIMNEAVEAAVKVTNKTLLFVEGGGNSLKCLGVEETVRSVVEGVRDIHRENKNVWTVMLSLIPRPRENWRYEEARLKTNERLFDECVRLYKEGVKVTFMNMDPGMNLDCFAADQVHFNDYGKKALGRIIISVVNRSAMLGRRVVQQPQ